MNKGWIKKHRKIRDHWLFEPIRPRTRLEAWEDLIMDAAFEDRELFVNDKNISIKIGQVYSSIRFLGNRWKWSVGKVQRFLKALQGCDMIHVETDTGMNLVTICNYDTYQSTDTPNDTTTIQQRYTDRHKVKELKELKNIYSDHFNEFWLKYPRKIGKSSCSKKYKIALKKADHQDIMDSLDNHIQSWKQTDLEYIPYPATWLNQERWNDVVSEIKAKSKPKSFNKTKTGLYIAYCLKCGNKAYPNDFQLKTNSCCGTDWVADKPDIKNDSKIDKQIIGRIMA